LVLVFGTVCIDRLRRIPHLPPAGGYVEIQEQLELLGGEAANTANALHEWGNEILLAPNALGNSPESDRLRQMIRDRGLAGTFADPGPMESSVAPVCEIYITPDGDRTMFGNGFNRMGPAVPIAELPYRAGEWFTAEPNMSGPSREAVAAAHAAGMKLYLMDFVREDDSIPTGAFWQCSTDWVGTRNNVQKNVQWVRGWVERHGCFAIVSDGPNGFVAGSPEMEVRAYPPFPAPAMVDSTGAGDMFRAGMLHGLSRGWPIERCLRFASAAGCLKCQYIGATSQVPTVVDIERHIAEHPSVARQYV